MSSEHTTAELLQKITRLSAEIAGATDQQADLKKQIRDLAKQVHAQPIRKNLPHVADDIRPMTIRIKDVPDFIILNPRSLPKFGILVHAAPAPESSARRFRLSMQDSNIEPFYAVATMIDYRRHQELINSICWSSGIKLLFINDSIKEGHDWDDNDPKNILLGSFNSEGILEAMAEHHSRKEIRQGLSFIAAGINGTGL